MRHFFSLYRSQNIYLPNYLQDYIKFVYNFMCVCARVCGGVCVGSRPKERKRRDVIFFSRTFSLICPSINRKTPGKTLAQKPGEDTKLTN